jgi:hypothetical protein
MTQISKRFEQLVSSTYKKLYQEGKILPVKVSDGILVGDVLIKSDGALKNLWKGSVLVYENVYLNDVAIRLANSLAKSSSLIHQQRLYNADKEYGKWLLDWQFLNYSYRKAITAADFNKADILMARLQESKQKVEQAKSSALVLARS